jgi:quercetin dioxygenase-like cupin family protein
MNRKLAVLVGEGNTKRKLLLVIALAVAAAAAAVAIAANVPVPTSNVDPATVPVGFLARGTHIDDAAVSSFARAIKQSQGSTVVLQHIRFADGQETNWHTHPGPVIVLVVKGQLDYISDRCEVTHYREGTGFVDRGFGNVHNARAVGPTEFYAVYYLPDSAGLIREDSSIPC